MGDKNGAILVAHACAGAHHTVAVLQISVGMAGNRSDFKFSLKRPLIQTFNVLDDMLNLKAPHVDCAFGNGIEHKGVIGVRAMAKAKNFCVCFKHRLQTISKQRPSVKLLPFLDRLGILFITL